MPWVVIALASGILAFILFVNIFFWIQAIEVPKKFPDNDFQKVRQVCVKLRKIKLLSWFWACFFCGNRVRLMRRYFISYFGPLPPEPMDNDLKVSRMAYDGVKVKIYEPTSQPTSTLRPGMVYLHGGCWILGNVEAVDPLPREIAKRANIVVVSVDYRLAPEHVYPIPFEDCLAATKCFLRTCKSVNVDPERVCIAGDDAGGNLAAAVALKLRDEGHKPALKMQVIMYPPLQALDFELPSFIEFEDDAVLDKGMSVKVWLWYGCGDIRFYHRAKSNNHTSPEAKQQYMPSHIDQELLPKRVLKKYPQARKLWHGDSRIWDKIRDTFESPYFAPLLAKSMAGLPPTYLLTCEQAVWRDENLIYKHRLEEAEVPVQHEHYKAPHALLSMPQLEYAQQALNQLAEYLAKNM